MSQFNPTSQGSGVFLSTKLWKMIGGVCFLLLQIMPEYASSLAARIPAGFTITLTVNVGFQPLAASRLSALNS
jgi:hypothetical protein